MSLSNKELNEIFKKLEHHELLHVYNLLKDNSVKFTQTNTNVLFLDTSISPELLEKIKSYAQTRFSEAEKYRELYKNLSDTR